MDEICEKHQKGLKYSWGNPRLKEMFVVQNIEAIIIRVISFQAFQSEKTIPKYYAAQLQEFLFREHSTVTAQDSR